MGLVAALVSKNPALKRKLQIAKIDDTPEAYVKKRIQSALVLGFMSTILTFFVTDKQGITPFILLLALPVYCFLFLQVQMHSIDTMIKKRAKHIDKEVLFAGRFLLVKLNTGQPLINALMDASKSYGVASKYFKEIVRQIDLGTPLEDALERAIQYTPSEKFQKILFQITNALKIGIDVTHNLEAVLDEISNEQLVEIQRYGKKLNSMTLFYMLMGIVVPSLGFTIFIVISSLISFEVTNASFALFLGGLLTVQVVFLLVFKAIRPTLNI